MKHLLLLFLTSIVSAGVAYAGDVTVKAVLATGPEEEPTTTFSPSAEKIHALFKTKGASEGDKIRAVWMADDIGDLKPGKIDEKSLTLKGDTDKGDFSLTRDDPAWPKGKYHVDIYVNDELVTTVKFTVGGGKTAAKEEKKEEEEASGDEYSFKVHNTTDDKIKKLLASEDGKEWGSFGVGRAGIPAGATITLKWDKSTNNSDCKWYIKAVFDDGSETKAKKFDFCEEDLELEF